VSISRAFLFAAAALACLAAFPPRAATAAEPPDFIGGSEAIVQQNIDALRPHIGELRLGDGSLVPTETPEELKTSVIPYEDSRRVVNRGILSAMAEFCGLDWQHESFIPFMEQERAGKRWSGKQIAFIGGLHGITQNGILKSLETKGACPPPLRQRTQAVLDSLK
jgi:hypothetical protein